MEVKKTVREGVGPMDLMESQETQKNLEGVMEILKVSRDQGERVRTST